MVTFEEAEIEALVTAFYARIRKDLELAPVFASKIKTADWPHHEAKIVDFWSSVLRKSGRYRGNPMAKHAKVSGLSPELFTRWLDLFRETAEKVLSQEQAVFVDKTAKRIAQSLQMGLAFHYDGQEIGDHPFKAFGLRYEGR